MPKGKGSAFERLVCKQLSLWWTKGIRDDIFWRSTTSGARATVRAKRGKKTAGNHGDITYTDPIGHPLIDCVCFELKRGYSRTSFQDAIDGDPRHGNCQWVDFVLQAITSWQLSGSYTWALITKRDRKRAMVYMPKHFHSDLRELGAFRKGKYEGVAFSFPNPATHGPKSLLVFGMPWDSFLMQVPPDVIKELVK